MGPEYQLNLRLQEWGMQLARSHDKRICRPPVTSVGLDSQVAFDPHIACRKVPLHPSPMSQYERLGLVRLSC
jgi:hypothetical protein